MAEAAAASDKARSVANNFGATCFRVRRDGAPELDGRRCQKRRQKRFVRLAEETPNIGEEKGTQNRAMNEGLVSRCAARQSEGGACRSTEDLRVRCVGSGVTEAGLTGREGGPTRYHETRAHALGLGMLDRGKKFRDGFVRKCGKFAEVFLQTVL